jgi:hypothetical protein
MISYTHRGTPVCGHVGPTASPGRNETMVCTLAPGHEGLHSLSPVPTDKVFKAREARRLGGCGVQSTSQADEPSESMYCVSCQQMRPRAEFINPDGSDL